MNFGNTVRVSGKVKFLYILLIIITGCARNPILDNTRNIILCIDGNCNVVGIDAKSGKDTVLIKNRTEGCLTSPTWMNDSEFIYYIDPLAGTPRTIHPLILVNLKKGKQNMLYKQKNWFGYITCFHEEKILFQDGAGSRKLLLIDAKTGELDESFAVYIRLRRLGCFEVLNGKDSLILHGLGNQKYEDLPRYPTGYIQDLSDSLDDIYIYDIGEDKLIQLTDTRWSDIHPVWSPDGKYIAFASNKEGTYDIYVMELETREVKQLTSGKGNDQYPEYSPDGSKIAFISDRSGKRQVWLINPDGSGLKQLTEIETGVGGLLFAPLSWNPKNDNTIININNDSLGYK